jgi:isopentenyl-diphosphate Delta-isomerase
MRGKPVGLDGEELVELVDEAGRTVGTMGKLAAHQPPGRLHRAISVFLLDQDDRLLLQRRAEGKYHSGGLWSNTCCSHPRAGEPPAEAAARRVREELGVTAQELTAAGTVIYRVTDPVSGLVEHEFNHLFTGRVLADPSPDLDEIAECAFVALPDLERMPAPGEFTAWFPIVLQAATPALAGRP